jgi:4-hydroxybenzoate polyprenyltransferase
MIKNIIQLLRPAHWVKNFFVFIPLIFSGAFIRLDAVIDASLAAMLFCLASSVVYIANDIHDVESDRQHANKVRLRPLASGALSVKAALYTLFFMLGIICVAGFLLFPVVLYVLLAYIALMLAYTWYLKYQPVLDIFTIAIGFVLRIYAGAIAIDVPVSPWTFVTALSLALYLAAIKRRQELLLHGSGSREVLNHYTESLVTRFAEISATSALVFYSIYVLSSRPELIMTIPIVLFGLFRYWYIVESFQSGESPTDAILKDFQLVLTVLVWIATTVFLIWEN